LKSGDLPGRRLAFEPGRMGGGLPLAGGLPVGLAGLQLGEADNSVVAPALAGERRRRLIDETSMMAAVYQTAEIKAGSGGARSVPYG